MININDYESKPFDQKEYVREWQRKNKAAVNEKQKNYRKRVSAERKAFEMILNHFTHNNTLDKAGLERFINEIKDLMDVDISTKK